MRRFRVISDLHLDVNSKHPLRCSKDDVFTVICGDTSGDPQMTIKWINDNIGHGVGVSGNHLPYNDRDLGIQDLRKELADAFPSDSWFTYLDVETGTFMKEVDGIIFMGSCGYSNFRISHPEFNPTGDRELNFRCSEYNMNDYKWGRVLSPTERDFENKPKLVRMTAKDYEKWFLKAFNAFDKALDENEKLESPKPVVLITHHAWVTDAIEHNGYMEHYMYSRREFNWSSYASNMQHWLIRHPSIKCYCYGHIHDIYKGHRDFTIDRQDGSKILVINNCRGYAASAHDFNFNYNRYVNTDTWTVEEDPLSEEESKERKARSDRLLAFAGAFL